MYLAETKTLKQKKPVPFEVSGGNLHHFKITVFQSVTQTRKGRVKEKELT